MSAVPHSAPALAWSLSPVISARSSPSCWPSWPASRWKLRRLQDLPHTGDKTLEPYRVIARKMLQKPADAEITDAERQLGKGGELASDSADLLVPGAGSCHTTPAATKRSRPSSNNGGMLTRPRCKFWKDLARAIANRDPHRQPILVAPPPRPPLVAAFADGNLTLALPSGRTITYPEARLVPGKFEDAPSDVEFKDNARGQWKAYRGWFGTFVENVVQAPPEIYSPRRSNASNLVAFRSCSTVMTKPPLRFRLGRCPTTNFSRSC